MSKINGLMQPLAKAAIVVSVISLWPTMASAEPTVGIGFQWVCTIKYYGEGNTLSRVKTGRVF